jgi:error-prone DNA polymerase
VRRSDVCASEWDCTLERVAAGEHTERGRRAERTARDAPGERPAVRLGLRLVKGLSAAGAARIVAARAAAAFADVRDLAERSAVGAKDLGALAAAGALKSLAGHRHGARWDVAALGKPTALLGQPRIAEGLPLLRRPSEQEDIDADYRHAGLTLGRHPLELLRERLVAEGILTAAAVAAAKPGRTVYTAGLVITRQRPSSAAGVTVVTLEDETGYVNLIVWEKVAERDRRALLGASLLGVVGRVQREGEVLHIVAARVLDLSKCLGGLAAPSRDFR